MNIVALFTDDDESITTSEKDQNNIPLRVLLKTRRRTKFNPHGERSKYICIPRNVKEAGTHMVYEYQVGSSLNVPTDIGFSHHYRFCESGKVGMGDCINDVNEVDRTVYKYKDTLLRNVKNVMKKLSKQCTINQQFL